MTVPEFQLVNDAGARRYRLMLNNEEVGYSEYDPVAPASILIKHTEVLRQHEGKGFGSHLVRSMLDDIRGAREDGDSDLPVCDELHPKTPRISGYCARRYQGYPLSQPVRTYNLDRRWRTDSRRIGARTKSSFPTLIQAMLHEATSCKAMYIAGRSIRLHRSATSAAPTCWALYPYCSRMDQAGRYRPTTTHITRPSGKLPDLRKRHHPLSA